MNKRFSIGHAMVVLLAVFAVCALPAVACAQEKDAPSYSKGRFIVKFKGLDECPTCLMESSSSGKFSSVHELNKKHGVRKMESMFFKDAGLDVGEAKREQKQSIEKVKALFGNRARRGSGRELPDLSGIFMMEVPEGADVAAIVEDYKHDPNVEYAQPDFTAEANLTVNDPYYSSKWGLQKIQADLAWDLTQGNGIVVAVVDTGIDYNHEDLAANVWKNPLETYDSMDDDGNGYVDDVMGWNFAAGNNDPFDGHSHGTHVSGIIAAVGNNQVGVIGVAPQAKIMPVKGLSDSGSGSSSNLAKAILYAADNGADVISNSWGCSSACPSNPVVEDAVRTAYGLGAVVVFSAGNANADAVNYSPNQLDEPITVAASTSSDARATYSNYGAVVDVTAPGSSIYSTLPGNKYGYMSGTSMAAPMVSGLAALVLANHPAFTNDDVRHAIEASVDEFGPILGFDTASGHGRINAFKAVQLDSTVRPHISLPANDQLYSTSTTSAVDVMGSVQGTNFSDYTIEYRANGTVTDSVWTLAEGPFNTQVQSGLLGNVLLAGIPSDTYLLKISATDTQGHVFEDVKRFQVDNSAPATCTPVAPTITTASATYVGYAGGPAVDIQVQLTNNNGSACPTASYQLTGVAPTGWAAYFDTSNPLNVSSGQTMNFNWLVSVPAGTPEGNVYLAYIRADDTGTPGLTATSPNVSITVAALDTTPPTVSILDPADGGQYSQGRITISADASDNVAVRDVEFYVDGVSIGIDSSVPYSMNWNARHASLGLHTIAVRAADTQNNVSGMVSVQINLVKSSGGGGKGGGGKATGKNK